MQCALFFVLVIVNHALIPVGWWVGVGGGSAHVFGRNGALSRVTGDRCLSGAWAIFTKVEGDVWLGTLLYVCVRDESNRSRLPSKRVNIRLAKGSGCPETEHVSFLLQGIVPTTSRGET